MARIYAALVADPDKRTRFRVTPEDDSFPTVNVKTEGEENRLRQFLPSAMLSMARDAGDELRVHIDVNFFA